MTPFTSPSWRPERFIAECLGLVERAVDAGRMPPFDLYVDVRWDCVLAQGVLARLRRESSIRRVRVRNFPPFHCELVDVYKLWAR